MKIGDRIKNLRKSKDMPQVELADKIGVSKQTMYKYENNIITNIPSDVIERIAKIFNVSEAYLMGWEDTSDKLYQQIAESYYQYAKEQEMIEVYRQLNDHAQFVALENMKLLLKVYPREEKAQKEEPLLNAAHERTDIEITEEMKKHDDDIMDDENF